MNKRLFYIDRAEKLILSELFSKTYFLVKNNLVLVEPLLFFLLILTLVISPLTFAGEVNIAVLITIISVIGLFCAFCAGWFCMFHKSIEYIDKFNLSPEEKAINSLNLFREFFPGVGKYFLRIVFGFVIYAFLFMILMNIIHVIGEKFIGMPPVINPDEFAKAASDDQKIMNLLHKISHDDWVKIIKWNLMSFGILGFFSYFTMFWSQSIISEEKRPYTAYWESIKTVFKNPLATSFIYIAQCVSIIGVTLSATAAMNIIVKFILLMGLIVLVVYFIMMSFLYYERYK